MRIKFTLSAAALLLLSIVSCKKDSGGKSALDGNWNFTSMLVMDSSADHYNDGYEELTVLKLGYLTTNNKGTVSIGGGSMNAKGLSYSVDTVMTVTSYTDGTAWNVSTQPFTFTVPTTNSTSTFKLVGTDSLYFPSGGFASIGGMTTQTSAAGYKYNISGSTLTMTTNIVKDSTSNSQGYVETFHQAVKATVTLTRQ